MTSRRGSAGATEPNGGGTVLWVGDPADAGRHLRRAGWTLRTVAAGGDLPDVVDADCVVVAHAPPAVDAPEVVELVQDRAASVPTVVYAEDGSEALAGEVVAAGATGYVPAASPEAAETLADRLAALRGDDREARLFRALVEESPSLICVVDAEMRFSYLSPGSERLVGRSADALLGERAAEYIHEADRERVRAEFQEFVDSGGDGPVTFRFRRPDGEYVHLSSIGRDLRDDPAVGGIVVYCRDVTNRVTAQRELEETRELFHQFTNNINATIWVATADMEDYLFVNRDGLHRAYEVDELKDDPEVYLDSLHPDDRQRERDAIATLRADARDGTAREEYRDEFRLIDEAGEVHWLSEVTFPIRDDAGEVIRWGGIVTDVSERVRYQRELEVSEARFRQIADNTSDIIWLASADFAETLYINRAYEELGYSIEEFNDDPLAYMRSIHPDDREQELATVERLKEWAETGDAPDELRDAYRMYDADGDLRWMNEVTFPIRNEADEVIRWAGVITDITAHKRQEAELRRQNERLEEFASVVSHDLRNPLNVAQGRVALAQETGDDSHLRAAQSALDRMDGLIDGLLTVARESGRVSNTESIPLDDVVVAAWGMTAHADASLVTDADLGSVDADHERLQRLFENLFRNSVEHGSTSSRAESGDGVEHGEPDVTVRVGRLSSSDTDRPTGFYVEDDGPGIPADERDRVFEKGYTGGEGTGFGLAIVGEIVAAHGWEISLTSSAAGGARFEVTTE